MGGKLNVFGLGSLGVNVDKNPINLEDGELPKAQNAIHDPAGSMGGIRKRKGLTKVNSVAAAGAVKGAIGVPISIGTAGNDVPAVAPNTRLFFQARRITTTTAGWNTSTDAWVTSPTTGGPDGYDAAATPRVPDYAWAYSVYAAQDTFDHSRAAFSGRPGVMYKNKFYYAGNDYTYTTTAPTIRMFDGVQDFLLGRVPSRDGVIPFAILCMAVGGDGFIYFSTYDSGVADSNTLKSRIFQLDPESGALLQIGSPFPATGATYQVPFDLCWHQGRLWTRTVGGGSVGSSQKTYFFRPGIDSDWTLDNTDVTIGGGCPTLISFQGQLFAGLCTNQPSPAKILVRSPLGVWTTSLTPALVEAGATTMISFGDINHFGSSVIFNGNLYVSYFNQQDIASTNAGTKFARIYKFDGTTWSAVYGPAGDAATCVPYNQAVVLGGKLFFVSAPCYSNGGDALNQMIYTSNGSSFTVVDSSILNNTSGGILGLIAS